MRSIKQAKEELRNEVHLMLMQMAAIDLEIYGFVKEGTKDCFLKQGFDIPEKFKTEVKEQNKKGPRSITDRLNEIGITIREGKILGSEPVGKEMLMKEGKELGYFNPVEAMRTFLDPIKLKDKNEKL